MIGVPGRLRICKPLALALLVIAVHSSQLAWPSAAEELEIARQPGPRLPKPVTIRSVPTIEVSAKRAAATRVKKQSKLPKGAQTLIDQFDQQVTEIRKKADREINDKRKELITKLLAEAKKQSKDGNKEAATALRKQLRTFLGVRQDPSIIRTSRGRVGQSYYFVVTGNKTGVVYGTGNYTDDSSLATAAVHAGILRDGQQGIVKVTIQAGQASYESTAKHGITTYEYGAWGGSYRVEASDLPEELMVDFKKAAKDRAAAPEPRPAPVAPVALPAVRIAPAAPVVRVASKRSWGPEQAVGPPDTPGAGDIQTAWASATPDGQDEWLEIELKTAVEPTMVLVHETYNPGALYRVTGYLKSGMEAELWAGKDPTERTAKRGVSRIQVEPIFKTKRVRIWIKSTEVPGYNEIDAVGVKDKEGKIHWAASVRASSTYAER